MSIHRKERYLGVLKDLQFSFILKFAAILLSFLLSIALARSMDLSSFGQLNVILSWSALLSLVTSFGTDTWIIKNISSQPDHSPKYLVVSTSLKLLGFLILAVLVAAIYALDFISGLQAISLISLVFILNQINTLSSLIKGHSYISWNYFLFDIVKFGTNLLLLLSVLSLAFEVYLETAVLLHVMALVSVLLAFTIFVEIKGILPIYEILKNIQFKNLMATARHTCPFLISGSLTFINTNVDLILVALLSSNIEAAGYAVCSRAAILIGTFRMIVCNIYAPKFSKLYYQKRNQELKSLYARVAGFMFAIAVLGLFMTYPVSFLLVIWGESYLEFKWCFALLSIGYLSMFAIGPLDYMLNMTGREKVEQWIVIGQLILNVLLNIVLIQRFGALGAGIATSISLVMSSIVRVSYYKQFL